MAYFGSGSTRKLNTLHPDLQLILTEAIQLYDFTILEGHRSVERQQQLFKDGMSKIDGIAKLGKHNYSPSMAVDLAPYPIDFGDFNRYYYLGGILAGIAHRLYREGRIAHKLRWGQDWDQDTDFKDQTFNDTGHWELVEIKE